MCHFLITQAYLEKYCYANENNSQGESQLKNMSQAVRKFQQYVGLPVTGMLKLLLLLLIHIICNIKPDMLIATGALII